MPCKRANRPRCDDLGRERLVRYCARPAIVLERLERLPEGRYSYRTKYARGDRTHRVVTGSGSCQKSSHSSSPYQPNPRRSCTRRCNKVHGAGAAPDRRRGEDHSDSGRHRSMSTHVPLSPMRSDSCRK